MKTILVDAINAFVLKEKGTNKKMYLMLEKYPNKKVILTSANDDQFKIYGFNKMPYEVFTLKHNPEKTNPKYYQKMLKFFKLDPKNVVYFEHNPEAVESARSVGITTHHYDKDKKDLKDLKKFLDNNL